MRANARVSGAMGENVGSFNIVVALVERGGGGRLARSGFALGPAVSELFNDSSIYDMPTCTG